MDITDFTYDEMEATFRRRRKAQMPKLWSYSKKLLDPYRPKYYTKIELFVPQPSFFSPFPCVLVSIRNTRFKTFFRVLDLVDLESIFTIPAAEHLKATQALQDAKIQASTIEQRINCGRAPQGHPGAPGCKNTGLNHRTKDKGYPSHQKPCWLATSGQG